MQENFEGYREELDQVKLTGAGEEPAKPEGG